MHQEDLVLNLKQALGQLNIPEITQTVLNLAEFMEHCEDAVVREECGEVGVWCYRRFDGVRRLR